MTTISIIGNTIQSKELAQKITNKGYNVHIHSEKIKNQLELENVEYKTLQDVLQNKIILLCTTKESFSQTLHAIKEKVKHNTIIIDVLKEKEYSTKKMKEILPKSVHMISMYPYNNDEIGIINVQTKLYMINMVKQILKKLGYKPNTTTAKAHDTKMLHK